MAKGTTKFQSKMNQIQEMRRQVEQEAKKIKVQCSHQNEKGKLKIFPVSDNDDFECKYCGTRFNMKQLSRAELATATKTVTDALEQIRCYSDVHADAKRITHIGELIYNLQESVEHYDRVVDVYGRGKGKGKKKKNRDRDDQELGSYGMGLSFMSGRR